MIRAFTLSEILTGVAVVVILGAIAVPNYEEAQMGAKCARVKSDMRTIAVGLEAYKMDYQEYIPTYHGGIGGIPSAVIIPRLPPDSGMNPDTYDYIDICGQVMTTPVAYLKIIPHPSPFTFVNFQRGFYFANCIKSINGMPTSVDPLYADWYGFDSKWGNGESTWFLMDGGPDGDWFGWPGAPESGSSYGTYSVQVPYDPTNGTVSWGNIWWLGGVKHR